MRCMFTSKRARALSAFPEALLERTGKLTLAMTLVIEEDKELARADAKKVLAAIEEQGFYLQMPPARDGYVTHYHSRES